MDARGVLEKLRKTGYVFTTAHRIRSEIRKMEKEKQERLELDLKSEMFDPRNADLAKAIKEILR
jgi:hypothetical protein